MGIEAHPSHGKLIDILQGDLEGSNVLMLSIKGIPCMPLDMVIIKGVWPSLSVLNRLHDFESVHLIFLT